MAKKKWHFHNEIAQHHIMMRELNKAQRMIYFFVALLFDAIQLQNEKKGRKQFLCCLN